MIKHFFAALLLLWPSTARANGEGVDFIGFFARYFQEPWVCEGIVDAFRGREINFGFLADNTFANLPPAKWNCIGRLLAEPKAKRVRATIGNGVCPEHKRCDNDELYTPLMFGNKDPIGVMTARLRARDFHTIQRWQDRAAEVCSNLHRMLRPDQTCYIQADLESRLPPDAQTIIFDYIWNTCTPRCHMVYSGSGTLPGTFKEGHGKNPGVRAPCIVSQDGTEMNGKDSRAWLQRYDHCDMAMLWGWRMNGLAPKEKWKSGKLRTSWPSLDYVRALVGLLSQGSSAPPPTPVPVPPGGGLGSVCQVVNPVTKPRLWKPVSEYPKRMSSWIMRGIKWRMANIRILSPSGAHVATMHRYGDFEGSGDRFYMCTGNGSCKSGEALKAAYGQVYVEGPGGICYGPINPTERNGDV